MGTDQLRVVIERGKEKGLQVFPSLKMQSCDPVGSDRCDSLSGTGGKRCARSRRDKRYLLHPRKPGLIPEELVDYAGGYPRMPKSPTRGP